MKLWYLLVVVTFFLVSFPIYYFIGLEYPFYPKLFLFVLCTGVIIDLLFLHEHIFIQKSVYLKTALIFMAPFLFIFLIDGYFEFVSFGENIGYQALLVDLKPDYQVWMLSYIKNSTIFFSITSLIGVALLPVKMIRSIFKQQNRI